MKKVIFILISLLVMPFCYSQNSNKVEWGNEKFDILVKGKGYMLYVDSMEYGCIVRKGLSLDRIIPNSGKENFVVQIENQEELTKIIKEYICPHVQKKLRTDFYTSMRISLIGDTTGKIVRVTLSYPNKLTLPLDKLNKMIQKIMKHCRLTFDQSLLDPNQSKYVQYSRQAYLEDICY